MSTSQLTTRKEKDGGVSTSSPQRKTPPYCNRLVKSKVKNVDRIYGNRNWYIKYVLGHEIDREDMHCPCVLPYEEGSIKHDRLLNFCSNRPDPRRRPLHPFRMPSLH